MTLKKMFEEYLVAEPKARERKNKDTAAVNILLRRYPHIREALKTAGVEKRDLVALVRDHESAMRAWRQILEQRPDLRGSDYDEKVELEEKKLKELGYGVTQ